MSESGLKSNVMSSYESAAIGEAMGLITDMLADPSLPQNVANGLKAINNLLKSSSEVPSKKKSTDEKKKAIHNESLKKEEEDEDEEDLPFTGERPSTLPKKLRNALPAGLLRRLSTSTWTTTTSATGMPTMQPEAVRMRDYATNNFRFLRDDVQRQPPLRQRLQMSQLHQRLGEATIAESIVEDAERGPTSPGATKQCNSSPSSLSPVYLKPRSMSVFAMPTSARMLLTDAPRFGGVVEEEEEEEEGDGKRKEATVVGDAEAGDVAVIDKKQPIGRTYELREEEISTMVDESASCPIAQMDQLNVWDYPIFKMSDMYKDTILTMISYKIFLTTGLMDTFKIPLNEFFQFFHALEMGYQDKSYHNRIHATDVLHGVYYLITQPVPGLKTAIKTSEDEQKNVEEENKHDNHSRKTSGVDDDNEADDYGILVRFFNPLELMALLTAAAMHDYDHPGRTNAFLVATHHPLAVLYNDRSVLENHHAASAWKLFRSDPRFDWICHLDTGEQKRFRFLVIEAILATDLKQHFEILAEFNAKVNETSGLNWSLEADKLLVSNMLIKMADINGPCKTLELHLEWTSRIHEEFFEQGDEEQSMGLPISPYMDRNHPQLAKLQDSFITHLISPLCYSLYNAHLLPGFWMESEDGGDNSTERSSGNSTSSKSSDREIWCPLTYNLKQNHHMWTQILKQESVIKDQVQTANMTAAMIQQQKQHQPVPPRAQIQTSKKSKDMDAIKEESPPNSSIDQQHHQEKPQHHSKLPLLSIQVRSTSQESRQQPQQRQPHQQQQASAPQPQPPPQPPPAQPQGKSSSKKKNKGGEKSKSYSCSGFFIRKKQQ